MKEQFLSFKPSEIYLGFKVDTAAAALGMVAGRAETLLLKCTSECRHPKAHYLNKQLGIADEVPSPVTDHGDDSSGLRPPHCQSSGMNDLTRGSSSPKRAPVIITEYRSA